MKYLFSLFILLSLSTLALAQETPKIEVFGGYSLTHTFNDTLFSLPLNHGFNTSTSYNFNKYFGIKADISGSFGSKSETFSGLFFQVGSDVELFLTPGTRTTTISNKSFLYVIGPQVSYRRNQKVTPFAHFLVGGITTRQTARSFYGSGTIPVTSGYDNTGFTMATGGGIDVNASRRLAIRVLQVDLLHARFRGRADNDGRFSTGIVFKFGH